MKLFLSIILTLFTCWAVSAQQRIYELSSQRKVPFQENAKELIKRFYEDLSECDTDPDFRKAFIKNNVQQNAKLKPDYYSEKEILQYLSCEQYIQGFLGEYKRRMEKAKPVFKQSAYTFSDFYLTSDGLSSYVIVDFDNVMTISGNVVFSNRVSFYCIFPTYNFYSNVLVLQIESKKKESKIISEKNNPSLNISSGSTKELYDKAVRLYNALDYKSAFALFKQLAEQDNNSAAQNYVGYMYQKGYGVTQDHVEAVKWYRKSAEQGNEQGQNNLGSMYRDGNGVAQDHAEAVKWYRKSAEQGNALGQCHLGYMYEIGKGIVQDHVEAVKWYRKSAEQGNEQGQNNLGSMYRDGNGVAQDHAEAVKWYRKSAEQGNALGQCHLGYMYWNGNGVAQDHVEAVKWYRKSADQGNSTAMYNMGLMYKYGYGVKKDTAEAVNWFKKAKQNGYKDADSQLKQLGVSE